MSNNKYKTSIQNLKTIRYNGKMNIYRLKLEVRSLSLLSIVRWRYVLRVNCE